MASIISAGTTDATSLNISGDKTGILQLASNNAVTAVTIDASQNVGIGTTSPENKLTLLKNTTAATENSYGISIQSVNTNAYTELLLGASDAVDAGIIQTAAKNTNFTAKNLALQPQGGNVGIGTSSPGSLFDVYKDSGTAYSSSNTIAMGQWARISNPNTVSGAGVSLMFRAAASSLATIACVSTAAAYSSALTFATRNSAGDISESMRIDSSGNVGIGSSPSGSKLHLFVGNVSTLGAVASSGLTVGNGGSNNNLCQIGLGYPGTYTPISISSITTTQTGYTIADLIFATRSVNTDTAPTERMRIDNAGRVNINTTSNPLPSNGAGRINMVVPNGDDGINIKHEHTGNCINIWRTNGDGNVLNFYRSNSTPQVSVGNISINASATSYQTSSDYRLKENITPMTGALAKVTQLKPVNFKWKTDGRDGQGFIAHELQAIVPDCVGGTKDEVDAEGNPKYQGVDTSFLVATLTAAIQEQQVIINALTARLEALENK